MSGNIAAPVSVAVVGAGYWGPNLVRNFLGCPATDLRWVCDLDARARPQGRRASAPRSRSPTASTTCSTIRTSRRSRSPPRPRPTPTIALACARRGQARAGREAARRRRSPTAEKLVDAAAAARPRPDVRPHLLLHAGGAADPRARRATATLGRPPVRRLGADQPRASSSPTSTCSGTSRRTTCRSSTSSCPAGARRSRWRPTAPTRSVPGVACIGYLTLQLERRRDRAHPRQLAEPHEDPHDDHRRLPTHRRVGRPEPDASGSASTTRASTSTRRPRRGDDAARRARLVPRRRHGRARAARDRGAAGSRRGVRRRRSARTARR